MSLKVALVGLGHMGKIHFNKLLTIDGVEVSAIADTNTALAGETAHRMGFKLYERWQDTIPLCQAAIIATPTETHHTIGKAFLNAGKHVFMEKPIAVNTAQAQELIDSAAAHNLVFQIGHLERFNPAFSHGRRFVEKPILIESTRTSPFTGRSTDVDVVLDLMIHDLDLLLSLVPDEIGEVHAQGLCFMTDKLDAVNVRIEFSGGCIANLMASRISSRKERMLTIYEEGKSLSIDLLQGKCTSLVKNQTGSVDTSEYAASRLDPVEDELLEFIGSIRDKKTPSITGIDGLKALALATRIKEHIAGKKRVPIIR
ncbi:MAG TPA: Gfo/Idh/MocA family oxidoreductase [Syntrophorhabdaceae bacterium]|nr:Gfo/Idh/MocA family oxidoreductase [Syntrophorhabdaceae bacterium]